MRVLAIAVAGVLGALALAAVAGIPLVVVLLVLAATASVSTNGLSNTAVTERAGAAAGRVMGTQNSAQNLVAAGTPPVLGALIAAAGAGSGGYALAFAVSALAATVAVPCIPVAAESVFTERD
jgi:MFS family permease